MKKTLAAATVAASLMLLSGCSGPYSSLDPAGPAAGSVAALTWAMLIGALTIFIGLILLCWYAVRRNNEELSDAEAQRIQNRWILAGGIALPVVTITALLTFGIPIGHSLLPLPLQQGEGMRIDIKARQWFWEVSYPDTDIQAINEIHIPVDTPVDFHISSADVIHSFWSPRLGGKIDAIPGRTNVLRLEANQVGEYSGQCAEFCGGGHAVMGFTIIALSAEDFEAWLQQEGAETND
ncbi:cytochrome C oxidase subunit II [Pseudidiomarina salinarum]|uniref:Cytochrome aa3 subunit 2 n=1 Tax=Pseudidiomarina salinarum TaxID=435908 RepID=A0A094IUK5_9GAMM|nr:cytochrome c oxidase subunit II [Pseudidiomarina salinarum]KFZ30817.1 cytochrome C oxidase subunit II [Pseudidiomarina salinarum]RUO71286.1 cytochrome c oxidase subunit II [Pseudidiomarina salinarum]